MKSLTVFITLFSLSANVVAKNLDDWSNEDLCRWIDALQVPDPILLEIEIRDLVCLANPEIIEVSIKSPLLQNMEHCFLHLLLNKNSQ
jgi:hypothetical protein